MPDTRDYDIQEQAGQDWDFFLDVGGREHIIISSSLMELSYEGKNQVGAFQYKKTVFIVY